MKIRNRIILGILSIVLALPIMTSQASAASNPKIDVDELSHSQFRITITNAPSYSQVDLYYHQSDSDIWNAILNMGSTDRYGKYSTTRTFNSFHPNLNWFWYANVEGRNTPSITTGDEDNDGDVLGETTYDSGTLVVDNGTVYLIYRDEKIGFANEAAFLDSGFKWSSVIYGSTSGIPLSYIVTNGTYSHPWGSWVQNGKTIYFRHEDGLIPVTTMEIFRNNGGKTSLLVPANKYDLRLDKLSKMKNDDSRLK